MIALLTTLTCLFLLPPASLRPVNPPETPSEVISVQLVLVPVVVRGSRGFVEDLDRGDFRVLVDGREIAIESFDHGSEGAISLVFLQDLSGSMANHGRLEASREVVGFFLRRARPIDEMAIATFADGATRVEVPFTRDKSVVAEAVAAWQPYGVTALHDAVARLPEISGGGQRSHRAAILLTDGADNASLVTPKEARALVRQAELPVYVFGLDSGSDRRRREPEGTSRYEGLLRSIAAASGGRFYEVEGPGAWKEAALDVSNTLRSRYVLGFAASGSGPVSYHRIRVEVRGRRRHVSARAGYLGTLPAALQDLD